MVSGGPGLPLDGSGIVATMRSYLTGETISPVRRAVWWTTLSAIVGAAVINHAIQGAEQAERQAFFEDARNQRIHSIASIIRRGALDLPGGYVRDDAMGRTFGFTTPAKRGASVHSEYTQSALSAQIARIVTQQTYPSGRTEVITIRPASEDKWEAQCEAKAPSGTSQETPTLLREIDEEFIYRGGESGLEENTEGAQEVLRYYLDQAAWLAHVGRIYKQHYQFGFIDHLCGSETEILSE